MFDVPRKPHQLTFRGGRSAITSPRLAFLSINNCCLLDIPTIASPHHPNHYTTTSLFKLYPLQWYSPPRSLPFPSSSSSSSSSPMGDSPTYLPPPQSSPKTAPTPTFTCTRAATPTFSKNSTAPRTSHTNSSTSHPSTSHRVQKTKTM